MNAPPSKAHALRTRLAMLTLQENRFSDHVNNARYLAFINGTFPSWYRAMGLRELPCGQAATRAIASSNKCGANGFRR
jgi:hypothetical protein